jgi:xylulokinase
MRKDALLLGIDVGTGSVKAALFTPGGSLKGLGQREYSFSHPRPMWSELPPQTVWERMTLAVRDCLGAARARRSDIAGLGFSCIGDTGIALDGNGEPVYPAIECTDQRAGAYEEYIRFFEDAVGSDRIFDKTGYPLSSLPPVHKILWLRDNLPDVYSRISRYGTFQEYLIWKMTGNVCVDYSLASRTMAFDIAEKRWLTDFLDSAGIPADIFSEAVPSSHIAGFLTSDMASQLSLPSGLPVVTGAHDQCCSALGMGILSPELAGDGSGSMEALLCVTGTPKTSALARSYGIGCQCHSLPGKYLSLAFHLTAGSLVRWYRDQLGGAEVLEAAKCCADAYDVITRGAAGSPPGANGILLLPHFLGSGTGRTPPMDASSRGALFGLSLSHTRQDMARAFFEGVTYEMRFLLENMEKTGGGGIEALVVTGGAAKSPFWLQMKADITGRRILVPEITETSCLGAAMLAGIGTGTYAGWEEAVSRACSIRGEYVPSRNAHERYDSYFQIYKDLYGAVAGINSRLAAEIKKA